jgi:D-beta-D-heptose 7-phosphate kinase/D-beta-D-heptose 1-phosphate adenosyltransferase
MKPPARIVSQAELAGVARRMGGRGRKLVLTNGCFDILHAGHVRLLRGARRLGDALAVAVNSDASVRRLKGRGRPLVPLRERMEVLAALEMVDYVVPFGGDTPLALIRKVRPHVLVKGADWPKSRIVGRAVVEGSGGAVRTVPLRRGLSTSRILRRIVARFGR